MTCSQCGREMGKDDWSCPHCGNPGEATEGPAIGTGVSAKGMLVVLLVFAAFPVLLFLLHIFVPGL